MLLLKNAVAASEVRTKSSRSVSHPQIAVMFRSSNIEIIVECRNHFGVELPSVQLAKRFKKFSDKICNMIA